MALTSLVGFIWNGASDSTFAVEAPNMKALEIDALLSEVPTYSKNVTQFAVEDGKPVSDGIKKQPITLSLECFVSNSPIRSLIDTAASIADGLLGGGQRNQEIYNQLLALYEYDDVVTVYTRYKTFENMAISQISPARKPEDGDALIFTMELQEVRKAVSATAEVPAGMGIKPTGKPAAASDTAKRAGVTKNAGQNTGISSPLDNVQTQQTPTALFQVIEKIKGFQIPGGMQ